MHRLSDEDFQRAYRYALALTGTAESAFDLVHGTVAALLQRPFPARDPLPYLLKSVRNRFIDETRRARVLEWAPLEEAEGVIATDLSPLEDSLVREDLLLRLWQKLSPPEREVLFLWAVEGYTIDEIASHTGTPRGTLLARLHRLRRRLSHSQQTPARGAAR